MNESVSQGSGTKKEKNAFLQQQINSCTKLCISQQSKVLQTKKKKKQPQKAYSKQPDITSAAKRKRCKNTILKFLNFHVVCSKFGG